MVTKAWDIIGILPINLLYSTGLSDAFGSICSYRSNPDPGPSGSFRSRRKTSSVRLPRVERIRCSSSSSEHIKGLVPQSLISVVGLRLGDDPSL